MLTEMKKIETRLMFNFRSIFDGDAYSLNKYLMKYFPESATFGPNDLNLKLYDKLPTILPKLILKNNLFEIRASKKSIELKIKERAIKHYTYEFIGRFNDVPELMGMQVVRMNYMVIFGKSYSDFIDRFNIHSFDKKRDWEFVFKSSLPLHYNSCKISESITRWDSDEFYINSGVKLKKAFCLPLNRDETRKDRLEYLELFFSNESKFFLEQK